MNTQHYSYSSLQLSQLWLGEGSVCLMPRDYRFGHTKAFYGGPGV